MEPKGSKMEPKDTKIKPTVTKMEPKGTKREPKGDQKRIKKSIPEKRNQNGAKMVNAGFAFGAIFA